MQQKIIIGLGNPGEEFENTYHNAGQMAVWMLATRLMSPPWKREKNFEYITTADYVFVKPMVFMNESGKAVLEALKKFNAKPKDLIVVHDDSDLILGTLRTSIDRNSGGHKGVRSIIDTLGTKDFSRIRIGIRQPVETKRRKAGEFALKRITKKDLVTLEKVFEKISLSI